MHVRDRVGDEEREKAREGGSRRVASIRAKVKGREKQIWVLGGDGKREGGEREGGRRSSHEKEEVGREREKERQNAHDLAKVV